uniref:Uncharacterized protein n=1 Tax=Heterorhabditis bacteriophora TaxID=37862 RepID=A0A1I7XMY8_HETBA
MAYMCIAHFLPSYEKRKRQPLIYHMHEHSTQVPRMSTFGRDVSLGLSKIFLGDIKKSSRNSLVKQNEAINRSNKVGPAPQNYENTLGFPKFFIDNEFQGSERLAVIMNIQYFRFYD